MPSSKESAGTSRPRKIAWITFGILVMLASTFVLPELVSCRGQEIASIPLSNLSRIVSYEQRKCHGVWVIEISSSDSGALLADLDGTARITIVPTSHRIPWLITAHSTAHMLERGESLEVFSKDLREFGRKNLVFEYSVISSDAKRLEPVTFDIIIVLEGISNDPPPSVLPSLLLRSRLRGIPL